MKNKIFITILILSLPVAASATDLIVCDPVSKDNVTATGIWPAPYLSRGKLCFDMKTKSGNTCVTNGHISTWFSEGVIVSIDGESQGRDDTWFRVVKPVITNKEIEYTIEASRDNKYWGAISHVSINRVSGKAVDWFINEHGGTSYNCHLEGKKI
ncbi:MAG: hypothetical protein XXXJIFNMEKO3_00624 [Candidatus Erwinia impunctatus]|nr:hypothetical protein XXXJIFNMEKO_00624 [Culicoides impunctatus]